MIRRLLIANRGEIACRIAKTANGMGVHTIALASDADRFSLHVAACDDVVHMPGNTPTETYLQRDLIIAAAKDTHADAIHPGYGFLSEDPEFAQMVVDAGLIWVGPSAAAIRAIGLKDAAKALMEQAGVPVVPGYHGADQDDAVLANAASDVGYPVLIKAVAGGGGKGMRLVNDPEEFHSNLTSARSEAASAFGNDAVLIEKFIPSPRHIEIQIFGDGTDAVHLYERDCSLQRRHQKVIEEAPAPGMTDDVRAAMGQAAVRAAQAIGYAGAGTVEFIVDGRGALSTDGFYFMEMNTRLQVEHPITEEILGIDLVDWQLQVAAGGSLPLAQNQIVAQGHSVEARLYAEDAQAGFLPSIGALDLLEFGPGLRVDTGVRQGDVVSPYYDPMIAKVIATGPNRTGAIAKLEQGLKGTKVAGVTTNRDFLIRLLQNENFMQGQFDTGLIADDLDRLLAIADPGQGIWALVAVLALGLPNQAVATPYQGFAGFGRLSHHIDLTFAGVTCSFIVTCAEDIANVRCGHEDTTLTFANGQWSAPGLGPHGWFVKGDDVFIFAEQTHRFQRVNPLKKQATAQSDGAVLAPMPGIVREVFASSGDHLKGDAPILVLEAMKMQHTLCAPFDGTISDLEVRAGDQVIAGQVLAAMVETDDA